MPNNEKYNIAFIETFGVTKDQLPALAYQSIPEWDSVGHMQLIATLEDAFDIMFDTDDIIDFSSYEIGKKYIAKFGIDL